MRTPVWHHGGARSPLTSASRAVHGASLLCVAPSLGYAPLRRSGRVGKGGLSARSSFVVQGSAGSAFERGNDERALRSGNVVVVAP